MRRRNTESPLIKVRTAKLKDVLKIAKIEKESFDRPWGADAFAMELFKKFSKIFVVECDSGVSGYAVVWFIGSEAYIANVAVAPRMRGKGLATCLIDAVIGEARERGCSSVVLEVKRGNKPAINLYKKFGFEVVGVREKMYSDGEDGLIMEKLL